eukprot:Awhi_evm1s4203
MAKKTKESNKQQQNLETETNTVAAQTDIHDAVVNSSNPLAMLKSSKARNALNDVGKATEKWDFTETEADR